MLMRLNTRPRVEHSYLDGAVACQMFLVDGRAIRISPLMLCFLFKYDVAGRVDCAVMFLLHLKYHVQLLYKEF